MKKDRNKGRCTHHEAVDEEVVSVEGREGSIGDDPILLRFPELHSSKENQKGSKEKRIECLH